jgi:glycerol-3-phosphate acyltransferase PlsY
MPEWLIWSGLIVGAYLVGSIPFGVLIARSRGVDIRQHGSRNIGATNVGRVLGRRFGIICFVLDVLKGAGPVVAAGIIEQTFNRSPAELSAPQMWLWLAVAIAAIAGHMASVFLRFAGGKGVATSFGAMVAMWPLLTFPAIGAVLLWYAALRLSRYVSVASITAAASLPAFYAVRIAFGSDGDVVASLGHGSPPLIVTILLAGWVTWRHRGNIARLRRGVEPKIGASTERERTDDAPDEG